MMTDDYTGFGSYIILEPQHLNSLDGNKNDFPKCRNLRLQFKYFTLQGHPEDSKNNFNTNDVKENVSYNVLKDERLFVIETNSCESFHSCFSSTSNTDLPKTSLDCGDQPIKNNSKEEFFDQITMVNAIFLNKSNFKVPNSPNGRKGLSSVSDQSSGDRTSAEHCTDGECPLVNLHTGNIGTACAIKENRPQEHSEIIKTTTSQETLCANNSGFKTLKINKQESHEKLLPEVSKNEHETILGKLQHLKRGETKYSTVHLRTPKSPSEVDNEIHKGVLLHWKQGIHEGYEMHFLEPIEHSSHSIALVTKSDTETSNIDATPCENDSNIQNQECEIVDSCNDFEESFSKLFNSLKNSDELKITENSNDFSGDGFPCELNTIFNHKSNLICQPDKDENPVFEIVYAQDEIKMLNELEVKGPEVSQSKTSETLKSDQKNVKPESFERTNREKNSALSEYIGSGIEGTTGERVKMESGNSKSVVNPNRTSSPKRRTSASRQSSLPVIEESPEPPQETPNTEINDYCLVDTYGRSIYLFDHKGLPLTDGCGRPLKSAVGEFLLKCDDHGNPVVDEETHIFDILGKQPHEEGFQPWLSPLNTRTRRLTLENGCPMVLFDVEGKPLTSVSGTLLVDRYGQTLLKLKNL